MPRRSPPVSAFEKQGATHWTYIGSTIGVLVGLIVAAAARGQWVDAVAGPR